MVHAALPGASRQPSNGDSLAAPFYPSTARLRSGVGEWSGFILSCSGTRVLTPHVHPVLITATFSPTCLECLPILLPRYDRA